MAKFRSATLQLFAVLILVSSSALFSSRAVAGPEINDDRAPAMFVDLVLIRPLGIVATALGTTMFVVSLPFTLLGGNVGEAGRALVVEPAKFTFARPLGKTNAP